MTTNDNFLDHGPGTARPEREGREGDTQPLPKATGGAIMHQVVIDELLKRLETGIRRYGQPLQAFNGRDAAQDAFDEVLDLSVYFAQMRIEMAAMRGFLEDFLLMSYPGSPSRWDDLVARANEILAR